MLMKVFTRRIFANHQGREDEKLQSVLRTDKTTGEIRILVAHESGDQTEVRVVNHSLEH